MHIDTKEVDAYLELQARKYTKDYASMPLGDQYAAKYGVASALVWDLIMDLELDLRAKRIKQMKAKS